jgi:hypothetical protein
VGWRARLTQGRTWLAGIVVAALAAALAEVFTDAFTEVKDRALPSSSPTPVPSSPQASALEVTVGTGIGTGWVFPRPVSTTERLPEPGEALERWIRDRGGVSISADVVSVVVQGTTSKAVVLTGLDVEVVRRGAPITGTTVQSNEGGPVSPRTFFLDLDRPRPIAVARPGEGEPGDPPVPAIDFPYKVSQTDPEVFDLVVTTDAGYYEWTALLRWVADGREGTTPITDEGGRPFRISARRPGPTLNLVGDRLETPPTV